MEAGAGKATTLTALRTAWELEHGEGSLIGLAPSAAAAEVLAESLGIATDNTAKWLHEVARLPDTRKEITHLDIDAACCVCGDALRLAEDERPRCAEAAVATAAR